MKGIYYVILPLSCALIGLNACRKKPENNQALGEWTAERRWEHIANQKNPETWDLEMLSQDKQLAGLGDCGPFEPSVFPVPRYDLLGEGSFKGLGSQSEIFEMNEGKVVMNSFYVKKNELNKHFLGEREEDVFFQILVLTDTIDTVNYALNRSLAISRNHPDYAGQGFVQTKTTRIDYFAFQTPRRNAYAIVNTRIFDLRFGTVVLIAPGQHGMFRALQLKLPEKSTESVHDQTGHLLRQKEVVTFFGRSQWD